MELKRCYRCGKFFSSANDICHTCVRKDSYELARVVSYLQGNPNADSLDVVSTHTGISSKNIQRYINNGQINALAKISNYSKATIF